MIHARFCSLDVNLYQKQEVLAYHNTKRKQPGASSLPGNKTNKGGLLYFSNDTRLHDILHRDEDIVGRMTIERSSEPLLIEVVSNEADATTQNEETIEGADLDVLVRLLAGEGAAVTKEVDEADSNATIDVQDKLERIINGGFAAQTRNHSQYPF